ncbi:diphthine--ammonia ligase [Ambystoma mexicanum]|uniref:diphthine--ammonia ligase n=1 Tax=Ambystoma mexicanum TaxID=8296 RepID=UPI0037E887EB
MRVVALISGGKDSTYNMMQCVAAGHQVVALANLRPADKEGLTDELDSYMYQTVGHQAIDLYAEAMGLPLYRRTIEGSSMDTGRVYTECEGDEVEDLHKLLKLVKEAEDVEGVSVGAILSDYQRVRVENVCKRLNLQPLAFLWRRHQEELLSEMILAGVDAIVIKVAAFGLDPDKHLGRRLSQVRPHLRELSRKYGVHVCGEGGEFETFTLDCPLFRKRIVVDSSETVVHSADAFAPVAYLRFQQLHLEDKEAVGSSDALPASRCPCQASFETEGLCDPPEDHHEAETPSTGWEPSERESPSFRGSPECSARSPQGHQWISGISGRVAPPELESPAEAAEQAFGALRAILGARGLRLEDVVLVHLYVKSMADFAAINGVYGKEFHVCPPARVCVEVPLPEGIVLWMDCLVHQAPQIPEGAPHSGRHTMHVQSISHWAPANIGPYSQAIQVGDTIFCAGQIALIPCTMQLACGGIQTEAVISLGHVEKVLEAMSQGTGIRHVLSATCYVTHRGYASVARAAWLQHQRKGEAEDAPAGGHQTDCGTPLVVVVVPQLPRGACIEWHVIASIDDPPRRSHVALAKRSGDWQIVCDAAASSSGSCASISLTLGWSSPSAPSVGSEGVVSQELPALFRELLAVLQKTLQKLSTDSNLLPLCLRAFYGKGSMDAGKLQIGLREAAEEMFGDHAPAVVAVPVLDFPGHHVLHVACWLSA